jgi:hypothetical protein
VFINAPISQLFFLSHKVPEQFEFPPAELQRKAIGGESHRIEVCDEVGAPMLNGFVM